jgi:hypothetical protein
LPTQQAECFYSLFLLYKASGEETKAKENLEKSVNLGCAEAKKRIQYSYPKLTEIFNRYRDENKSIDFSDLDNIIQNIQEIEKEDEYYRVCLSCLLMLKDYEHTSNNLMMALDRVEYSINAKTGRHPKYASLIVLIGALCSENQCLGARFDYGNNRKKTYVKLNERIKDDSPYKLIFQLKLSGQKEIVVAGNGSICDLRTASIVEQVVFFLETYGEPYVL